MIEFFMQNMLMQPVAAALPCPRPRAHVASCARVGVSRHMCVECVRVEQMCVECVECVECVVCALRAMLGRVSERWLGSVSGRLCGVRTCCVQCRTSRNATECKTDS